MSSIDLDTNDNGHIEIENHVSCIPSLPRFFLAAYCRTPCVIIEFDEEATTEILGSLVILLSSSRIVFRVRNPDTQ
jgi:hypothetical protein